MSILITGGTGFIGAEIVRMLVAQGRTDVVVAHRSGNFARIADIVDQVQTVQADLGDDEAIAALVADTKPTQIYHFGATLTGPGEADPQALLQSNVSGVITLFEAARQAGTEQFIFASSIGTYGRDLERGVPVDDMSLQRPGSIYGVTKVFAENLGAWYRGKYGLDFRGLRYPSIVGPGVTTKSLAQYTSWMIEAAAKGEPFSVWTGPDTVIPILYYKDAAKAAIDLAAAPLADIKTMNYLVDGVRPTPNAGELADAVRSQIPGAEITFDIDPEAALSLSRNLTLDDSFARNEWGWEPAFGLDAMIDDFLTAVTGTAVTGPVRYQAIRWIHDSDMYPVVIYSEIDSRAVERRKVEEFRDGRLEMAGPGRESESCGLSEGTIPTIPEILSQSEFTGGAISADDFEQVWRRALGSLGHQL